MEKEVKKSILIVGGLVIGILLVVLVFAYPVLDAGVQANVTEDVLYSYNFTQNVTYNPATDALSFSIYAINSTNSLHSEFSLN